MSRRSIAALLVLFTFWSVPIQLLASAIFGHASRQTDLSGEVVWTETSSTSKSLEIALLIAFAGIILVYFSQKARTIPNKGGFRNFYVGILTVLILLSLLANHASWSLAGILKIIIFLTIGYIVTREEFEPRVLKWLAISAGVLVLIVAVFTIYDPGYSSVDCRFDKCSVFGRLLNSFYPHQNSLALALLTLFPLVLRINLRWFRNTALIMASVLLLGTGARVAFYALAIFAAIYVLRVPRIVPFLPFIGLATSLCVFIVSSGDDLTGRGYIYQVVKNNLNSNWLFGYGPNALSDAYQNSQIVFLAYHDHGVAPSLIDRFGVPALLGAGVLLLVLALRIFRLRSKESLHYVYPFALLSLTFASETAIQIDILSSSAWTIFLFLAVSKFQPGETESPGPIGEIVQKSSKVAKTEIVEKLLQREASARRND